MSFLGLIIILIILAVLYILFHDNTADDCFEKDIYTCLNCCKNCKWHDAVRKLNKK